MDTFMQMEKFRTWRKSGQKYWAVCVKDEIGFVFAGRRHQIAIKLFFFTLKWHQAVRTAEEVQTLRERATMLSHTYTVCLIGLR
jgi:hypothetical protein